MSLFHVILVFSFLSIFIRIESHCLSQCDEFISRPYWMFADVQMYPSGHFKTSVKICLNIPKKNIFDNFYMKQKNEKHVFFVFFPCGLLIDKTKLFPNSSSSIPHGLERG